MNKLTFVINRIYRSIFQRKIFPDQISQELLIEEAADFFNLSEEEVKNRYDAYHQFHHASQYEQQLGERKTLSFEEAFLLYLAILNNHPNQVVEIGTQYGKSSRRILDILQLLNLQSCKLTCFDVVDEVKFFTKEEADLELYDVTNTFRDHVLLKLKPGVIYLDAHPYWLLHNVISEFLTWSEDHFSILAIHDCSRLLYKTKMKINKEDAMAVSSHTGHWERHVLSDIFQIADKRLENFQSQTHCLRIFSTPHGLAMIMPLLASHG